MARHKQINGEGLGIKALPKRASSLNLLRITLKTILILKLFPFLGYKI